MIASAMAVPMELELSAADEIGASGDYFLAEQNAAMEDAQAAFVLESPDEEVDQQFESDESPAIAGTIGQVSGETSDEVVDAATETVAAESSPEAATPAAPTAEPATPAPATPAPATVSPVTASAVEDFANDLDDAVISVQLAQGDYDGAKELFSDAKKSLKAAQSRLLAIAAKGKETFPLFDRPMVAAKTVANAEADAVGSASPPHLAEVTAKPGTKPDANAWRKVPVTVLLDHGLTQAVVDLLIERGVDNMGQLEDARADTYNRGLRQFKGVGQGKADKIEDASINWLTKNRDSQVLAEVQAANTEAEAAAVETVTDVPTTSAEPAAETVAVTEVSETSPASTSASEDPTENTPKALRVRAAELNTGQPNCLAPSLVDEGCWNDGNNAFERGDKMTDCGWLPGVNQDDWLRGWMAAKLLSEEE